ncbi:MAG: [protein-PII] uridylyltransferase [Candidatus Korobacteraceae bacterium]
MLVPLPAGDLRELYESGIARIRQVFVETGDGPAVVRLRSELVDGLVASLFQTYLATSAGITLVAVGGYGRRQLLPASDIDLLFLCESEPKNEVKEGIRAISRELWDLQMRLSPVTHTIASCDRLDYDNVEFTVSLLDTRYVAGDAALFAKLREQVLPRLYRREWQPIVQRIAEVNQARHHKYGDTIFHLEPNVKDTPGGLRDYQIATWLSLLSLIEKHRTWPEPGEVLAGFDQKALREAAEFLLCIRCFLHLRSSRDDNKLEWDAQQEAAQSGIGMPGNVATSPEEWTRAYFRHTRTISRVARQMLQEVPASRSALYRGYQKWRSRVSNADFSVQGGRILLQTGSVTDPELLLRTFSFAALHGLSLSADAEQRIARALPALADQLRGELAWRHLRDVLRAPNAGKGLREMHALGVLSAMIPEFHLIDSLVIRDSYHRYTVDEHTFVTIDNIHGLTQPQNQWESRLAEIKAHASQLEMLLFALLLHDTGKGVPSDSHVIASSELAEKAMDRLAFGDDDRELVHFLIRGHLDMSALLRRDIFAPETSRALAEKAGTPERLKLLCLLTYADIKAVHPEALTPWKTEGLWRLYIGALNHLNHSADQEMMDAAADAERIEHVTALVHRPPEQVREYVKGLPKRYVRSHSIGQITAHFTMAARLGSDPVQLSLEFKDGLYEVTVVTRDRPMLFATITGVLYAWGMDIAKADAFCNSAGVVVDTFQCRDRFRTLELNPTERERFKRSLRNVLRGEADLESLIKGRGRSDSGRPRIRVQTRTQFDNDSSHHSTVLEVIAQDRPGLLYLVASTLAGLHCDVEIALIDTEGDCAIDVFYLTSGGLKLSSQVMSEVEAKLGAALADPS